MHGERVPDKPPPRGSYIDTMMGLLLDAQEAQRAVLREALAPGGDPGVAQRVLLTMEQYL